MIFQHQRTVPTHSSLTGLPNRFDLYERCVQSPLDTARLLDAIHAGAPAHLAEDFAGSAALARVWLQLHRKARALATDIDPVPLARAQKTPRLTTCVADLITPPRTLRKTPRSDIIWVGNFSLCEIHTLADLRGYLRRVKARLKPGGLFVCDLYQGPAAWKLGTSRRFVPLDGGLVVEYRWRQVAANRRTRMVHNAIDFVIHSKHARGPVVATLAEAFTYRWRLWAARTLQTELRRAGFFETHLFPPKPDAMDHMGQMYVGARSAYDAAQLPVVLVAARVSKPRASTQA